jgi:hypothetical protein
VAHAEELGEMEAMHEEELGERKEMHDEEMGEREAVHEEESGERELGQEEESGEREAIFETGTDDVVSSSYCDNREVFPNVLLRSADVMMIFKSK